MAKKQVQYDPEKRMVNGIPLLYFYYAMKYGDKGDKFVSLDVLSGEYMADWQKDESDTEEK